MTPATVAATTTAIAVVEPPKKEDLTKVPPKPVVGHGFEPRDMRQLWWLCTQLVGTGFLPKAIKKPGQAVAVILAGKDFGLSAMQSLRSLNIVEGKIGMNADFMLGLMLRAGVRHEWLETNDKVATIRLERQGFKPMVLSYTYAMAERAGLTKGYDSGAKSNYVKHTEAMLRARAVSAAARAFAPDIMGGLYLQEELDDRLPQSGLAAAVDTSAFTEVPVVDGPAPQPEAAAPAAQEPTPVPREPGDDSAAVATERGPSALDKLVAQVVECQTTASLMTLWAQVEQLPEADRPAAKAAFGKRRGELERAKA